MRSGLGLHEPTALLATVGRERDPTRSLTEHLRGRRTKRPALPRAPGSPRLARQRRVVQPCVERHATRQIAVHGQIPEDGRAAIRRVGDEVEVPCRMGFPEPMDQLDGELGPRAVGPPRATGGIVVEEQANQDRQAEDAAGTARQSNDHREQDPAVSPGQDRLLARAELGIVVHADAIDLVAALVRVGVVERELHGPFGKRPVRRSTTIRPSASSDQRATENTRWNAA